jgi:hypothetical protein
LKNYLRCLAVVKNSPGRGVSKCSFTARKLRFFGCFCLGQTASPTFFNGLLRAASAIERLGGIARQPAQERRSRAMRGFCGSEVTGPYRS